jgi:hypothetical protein
MRLNSFLAPRPTYAGVTVYSAVLFTLGAAAIHLAVAPAHVREYVPFGVFFLVVGGAQTAYAIELAVRPTRRLALLMATGSAGLVGLWVLSRTVGLPDGYYEPGWEPPYGALSLIVEGLFVFAFLTWLGRRVTTTGTARRSPYGTDRERIAPRRGTPER